MNPYEVHPYVVTLRHDHGRVRIHIPATSAEQAVKQVLAIEGAPDRAVLSVKEAKR